MASHILENKILIEKGAESIDIIDDNFFTSLPRAKELIELMKKEMLRRKYSLRTIKTYRDCLNKFLLFCKKEPRKINKKDILLIKWIIFACKNQEAQSFHLTQYLLESFHHLLLNQTMTLKALDVFS